MEFPLLKHPSSMLVCGPSNCGKSYFVKRIIDEKIIKPFPPRIIWCYGAYQDLFNKMQNVEFYEGLPNSINQISNALIVIDDLMSELGDDSKLSKLFTKGSHHRDLSIIFIVQNMFHQGKEMRNISLNASYICCFKNLRDKQQINHLARQMYPDQTKFFTECFNDCTCVPYGYLFLDLKPDTDERLRVRTGIFPKDKQNIVYLPKNYQYSLTAPTCIPAESYNIIQDPIAHSIDPESNLKGYGATQNEMTWMNLEKNKINMERHGMLCSDSERQNLNGFGKTVKRIISSPNSCSSCPAKFTRYDDMLRHTQSKHNIIKYICNYCEKKFSRKDIMTRHMKSHY